jgi:hypothetical protein
MICQTETAHEGSIDLVDDRNFSDRSERQKNSGVISMI